MNSIISCHEELQFLEELKAIHKAGDRETLLNIFKIQGWNSEVIDLPFGQFCQQINYCKHDVKSYLAEYWQTMNELK